MRDWSARDTHISSFLCICVLSESERAQSTDSSKQRLL